MCLFLLVGSRLKTLISILLTKIEARYKNGMKWLPGTIKSDNKDGTYQIDYDNQDFERNVNYESIRKKISINSVTTKELHGINDNVEARYKGGARWFPGKVIALNRDGSYDIRYSDGDEEKKVPADNIRFIDEKETFENRKSNSSVVDYMKGDNIEARFEGGPDWILGSIAEVNRDGTYDIRYTNGSKERNVSPRNIRSLNDEVDEGPPYYTGDTIEVLRGTRGSATWTSANIVKALRNGEYDVRFR